MSHISRNAIYEGYKQMVSDHAAEIRDRMIAENGALRQRNAELVASLYGTLKLLRKAQDVLTMYLHPDSYDADHAVNLLLELLDGPEQRAIETPARELLRKPPV